MASNCSTNGSLTRRIFARISVPITDDVDSDVLSVWDNLQSPKVNWAVENNIQVESLSYVDVNTLSKHYALVALMSDEQLTEFLLRFE